MSLFKMKSFNIELLKQAVCVRGTGTVPISEPNQILNSAQQIY